MWLHDYQTSHCQAARQVLVTISLPNSFPQIKRHQLSGLPGAVSGINHSSGIKVGDKMGDGVGVGWSGVGEGAGTCGGDSKALKFHRAQFCWFKIYLASISTDPSIKAQQLSNHSWPVSMPLGTFLLREIFLCKGRMHSNVLIISQNN